MAYKILPATPADLPDIIAVHHAAFADDPFIGQLTANVSPEVQQAHDMRFFARQFEMSRLNGLRFRKAVDAEGCEPSHATVGIFRRLDHCALAHWLS